MKFSFILPESLPSMTVKRLLEDYFLIPRKIRHFLRTKKHLWVNQKEVNWQSLVQPGDELTLFFDDQDYPDKDLLLGEANLVEELYQDQHLIVVNKPEGMKTHANQPTELALLNHVSAYVGQTCYVVHRLDKETSGAVLFAKNPFVLPVLNRLLEKRQIKREYWALVEQAFQQREAIFREPIGRDRHDRRKRRVDPKQGKRALTRVSRLKNFPHQALLKCQLETGRTHQIRVHLAHHDHPLVGDPLYNPHKGPRLMLHAHRLRFIHPFSQKEICLEAPSASFEAQIQLLKNKG
ncbi:RluA family pseudouridine synthase [Streptococcus oricebi]|uniref:Pseudouridine synthase n=1 Tax=Streptococcus oricebi TaxID=1547447 RepID=A0ABS5B4W2_9STRE|nr:RluA family pseudouridine synthase [Streptococcus oricebi]MBP2623874.1 RluA family pseudouridine synthase [Streptococcus oricebi]